MFQVRRLGALVLGLMVGGGALLSAHVAGAAEPGLRLKVSVIQASKEKAPPDPALAKIQADLEEAFAGYQGFKRLQAEERELVNDAPVQVALPNGESAEFKHTGVDKNVHKLHLTLPKSKVNVDVTAPLKKVFFQAGMKHGNGMLILAMFLAPSDGAAVPAAASKP